MRSTRTRRSAPIGAPGRRVPRGSRPSSTAFPNRSCWWSTTSRRFARARRPPCSPRSSCTCRRVRRSCSRAESFPSCRSRDCAPIARCSKSVSRTWRSAGATRSCSSAASSRSSRPSPTSSGSERRAGLPVCTLQGSCCTTELVIVARLPSSPVRTGSSWTTSAWSASRSSTPPPSPSSPGRRSSSRCVARCATSSWAALESRHPRSRRWSSRHCSSCRSTAAEVGTGITTSSAQRSAPSSSAASRSSCPRCTAVPRCGPRRTARSTPHGGTRPRRGT